LGGKKKKTTESKPAKNRIFWGRGVQQKARRKRRGGVGGEDTFIDLIMNSDTKILNEGGIKGETP